MKAHLTIPGTMFVSLLAAGLCTGNGLLYLLAILIALIVAFCLAAVLWASATMHVSVEVPESAVHRKDEVLIRLHMIHKGYIPVAPILLELDSASEKENRIIRLKNVPGRSQALSMPLNTTHVGVFTSGIRSCVVEDLLGLFERRVAAEQNQYSVTVLPVTFETEPLIMAPGDPGSEIMSRATEDLSAPSDIRTYQAGDAIKKIHWKLSLRKRELMVRKYEEPILQEVLILLDCSRPPSWGHPEAEADIRDALLETAASLFSDQIRRDHTVRMPLTGDRPADITDSLGVYAAMTALANVNFSASERFERILLIESRRMQKVGNISVITARLNGTIVDLLIRIHRNGPAIRLYLITFAPDDTGMIPLISRLRRSGVEVAYVTPDPSGQT